MGWVLLVGALAVGGVECTEWQAEPPEALMRAEAARLSLRKARIEWSLESHYIPPAVRKQLNDPSVIVFRTWDMETFHVFQAAGRDRLDRNLGDAAGVRVYRLDTDEPATMWGVWGDRASASLLDDGKYYWRSWEGLTQAQVHPGTGRAAKLDLRMLGTSSFLPTGSRDVRILFASADQAEFCEQQHSGQRVVRMRQGEAENVFWIDPKRDYAITRVQRYWSGQLRFEARSRLKRFGDVWFPEVVEFYRFDHDNMATPAKVVRVRAAKFNTPDLPDDLTPADIGITPNHGIQVCDRSGREVGTARWTGKELVGFGDFLTTDPEDLPRGLVLASAGTSEPITSDVVVRPHDQVRTRLSAWERYTLDFIDRYRLDRQQAQRAWLILRQSQTDAQRVLTTEKRTVQTIERLASRLPKTEARQRGALREQIRKLSARLEQRLDAIFKTRLKPGLERLPTRAQRRAAEAKPLPGDARP